MSLLEELQAAARRFFRDQWTERDGIAVPDTDDVRLYNDGVNIDAAVLYADMAESTRLVNEYDPALAAEIYKSFLYCAARIIEACDGVVTAFDGDRLMGVFVGRSKNFRAADAALKINYAAQRIIMPAFSQVYTTTDYTLGHCVGIDTSNLLVARTGVRGSNDLIWVGRAANYAAKLSNLRSVYRSVITADVYRKLSNNSRYSRRDGRNMWTRITDEALSGVALYGSSWWRKVQ
jgi:class 3 adenylate cyclase